MRKTIIILLTLVVVLLTIGYARECQDLEDISSSCDLLIFTVNATRPDQVFTDARCGVSIYYPNGTASVSNTTMTNGAHGTGWHNYTFSQAPIGSYKVDIICDKSATYSRNSAVLSVNKSLPLEFSDLELNLTSVSLSNASINAVANKTLSWGLNNTNFRNTRWTLAWYLHTIYAYP